MAEVEALLLAAAVALLARHRLLLVEGLAELVELLGAHHALALLAEDLLPLGVAVFLDALLLLFGALLEGLVVLGLLGAHLVVFVAVVALDGSLGQFFVQFVEAGLDLGLLVLLGDGVDHAAGELLQVLRLDALATADMRFETVQGILRLLEGRHLALLLDGLLEDLEAGAAPLPPDAAHSHPEAAHPVLEGPVLEESVFGAPPPEDGTHHPSAQAVLPATLPQTLLEHLPAHLAHVARGSAGVERLHTVLAALDALASGTERRRSSVTAETVRLGF